MISRTNQSPSQLVPGAHVQLDCAPTLRMTVPDRESGVRITVIVLPLMNQLQMPDTGMASDLPRRASAFDVDMPSVEGVERQTIYVVATCKGKSVATPLFHVDINEYVSFTGGGQGHRVTVAGELYRHNGALRFKARSEGHVTEWDEFRPVIQCPYGLKGILADTRIEYDPPRNNSSEAPKHRPAPVRAKSTRPPATEEPRKGTSPTLWRLVYHSDKHGSSTRDVYVISIRNDRIMARGADGRLPKTFLISGIRELYDISTGEDMLPHVQNVARTVSSQLTA